MACRDCITGGLHEGTPVGRVETVHGLPAYISEPPDGQSPKGIIVIVPDALGWELNNSRILADTYARRTNARVYLPEFTDGHSMSSSLFASMDIIMGNGSMIWKMFVSLPLRTKCRHSTLTTVLDCRPCVRYPHFFRSCTLIAFLLPSQEYLNSSMIFELMRLPLCRLAQQDSVSQMLSIYLLTLLLSIF